MVKWPVLLLELAVVAALAGGGLYWYNRPDPLAVWHKAGATPYDDGCTTIVCDGQKADENEQPGDPTSGVTAPVTAPVQAAPSTTPMEGNLPALSPEEIARQKREHLLPNGAPEAPVTRHRATASPTPIRHHGMRRPATTRTRSPASKDICKQVPAMARVMRREDLIAAMTVRGLSAGLQRKVLACVGK